MPYPIELDDLVRRTHDVIAALAEEASNSADPGETYEALLHEAGNHPLPVAVAAVLIRARGSLGLVEREHLVSCGSYALSELYAREYATHRDWKASEDLQGMGSATCPDCGAQIGPIGEWGLTSEMARHHIVRHAG